MGMVVYGILCTGVICENGRKLPEGPDWFAVFFVLAAFATFLSSILISRRLAKAPKGILKFAKMVGLIMATAGFRS